MNSKDTNTNINNIYIVGMNHGDVSDKVKKLFSETDDNNLNATSKLGDTFKSNMVYLLPEEDNPFDKNAVAVYLESHERLGYVCRHYAPMVQSHIKRKGVGCISAQLSGYNKTAELISCRTEDIVLPEPLSPAQDSNEDWYLSLPVMRRTAGEIQLDTARKILYCALKEKHEWNDYLQNHIQTCERLMWLDLSQEASVLNMNIFFLMYNSPIMEVREASERFFRLLTNIGGDDCCKRWALWLHTISESKDAKSVTKKIKCQDNSIQGIDYYLRKLSGDLFLDYLDDPSVFSKRLYYMNIPNKKYRRILTLLAIRHNLLLQGETTSSKQGNTPSQHEEQPNEIDSCFRFPSEFTKEHVGKLVNKYYLGQSVNLALIEIVLFDHGQLIKRNNHTSFIRTLIAWGLLPKETDIKKTARGMAAKMKAPFPVNGYMSWDNTYLNDKQRCKSMAECLPSSMKYIR